MVATAISAAIRPYSMAVGPEQSSQSLRKMRRSIVISWCFPREIVASVHERNVKKGALSPPFKGQLGEILATHRILPGACRTRSPHPRPRGQRIEAVTAECAGIHRREGAYPALRLVDDRQQMRPRQARQIDR